MLKTLLMLVLCVLTCAFFNIAISGEVYIRGSDFGRGVLRLKDESCFAVLPSHIIGNDDTLRVTTANGQISDARPVTSFTSEIDISILAVNVSKPSLCPVNEWIGAIPWSEAAITMAKQAVIRLREEDGSLSMVAVRLVNYIPPRILRIVPLDATRGLSKGMSGGLLMLDGKAAGMLMSVNTATGQGTVYSWNYLDSIVSTFFSIEQKSELEPIGREFFVVEDTPIREEPRNGAPQVGTLDIGYKIFVVAQAPTNHWYQVTKQKNAVPLGYVTPSTLAEIAPWSTLPWLSGDVRARVTRVFKDDDKKKAMRAAYNYLLEYIEDDVIVEWSSPGGIFSSPARGTYKAASGFTEIRAGRWCRFVHEHIYGEGGGRASGRFCRSGNGTWDQQIR
jgi:hypothetical protein